MCVISKSDADKMYRIAYYVWTECEVDTEFSAVVEEMVGKLEKITGFDGGN